MSPLMQYYAIAYTVIDRDSCTKLVVFEVGQFNGVIEIYTDQALLLRYRECGSFDAKLAITQLIIEICIS